MNINALGAVALALVVGGILIAFGLQILGDIQDDMITNTAACGLNSTGGTGGTLLYSGCGADYNASGEAITATGNIAEKIPLIATIVVAVLIIGLLVGGFAMRK